MSILKSIAVILQQLRSGFIDLKKVNQELGTNYIEKDEQRLKNFLHREDSSRKISPFCVLSEYG